MIACIIEYGVRPGMEGKLEEVFGTLVPRVQAIDGFISMDNFRSQTNPDVLLEISYWRDEGALQAWIADSVHRKAMPIGRNEIFSWYRIKSTRVTHEINWTREVAAE